MKKLIPKASIFICLKRLPVIHSPHVLSSLSLNHGIMEIILPEETNYLR